MPDPQPPTRETSPGPEPSPNHDDENIPYTQFACIGSGFSAIGLGATLQRWYGISSIRFFERAPDLGGTWTVNQYPGAACDVPSALYSFSFATNPSWTRILPPGGELRAYLRRVAGEYGLVEKMVFGAEVERCEWIEETGRWRLSVRDVLTGEVRLHECQFLFAGTGQFSKPREWDVPGGVGRFKGVVMHSARWRGDVDLEGKRVVVIGNGCTATQIVPAIAGRTKHLTQIVRGRHWIVPPTDKVVPAGVRRVLQWTPGMLALQRFIVFVIAEVDFAAFSTPNRWFRARRQAVAEAYMRKTAPEKYHGLLIPEWEYGCKRRIFDSGYLQALHAPNITLTDEPVVEVVEDGVRLRDGTLVEADVIVLANGFQMNDILDGVPVVGRGGKTLKEHWQEFGGVEAYNLTSLNGFPNFFFPLGHTSTVMTIENAINYALRIIKPLLEGKASIAEVKREAEEVYVKEIHAKLDKMVWATGGCNSWYKMESGVNGNKKGWNGMTYPWWSGHYWYRCLFPVWKDWEYSGKPSKSTIIKKTRYGLWLTTSLVVVLGGVLMSRWIKVHGSSSVATLVAAVAQQAQVLQRKIGLPGLLNSLRVVTRA
ncbi:monooxygenase [Cercophora newfieldiana]|uniref:Monooxygenase n=1 Tax=Cercophora newfieldiana TaxID=92897 RepID=A0AA40CSF4_9PEZI|nr:monooxygenase [Cercophora newfieldiana]